MRVPAATRCAYKDKAASRAQRQHHHVVTVFCDHRIIARMRRIMRATPSRFRLHTVPSIRRCRFIATVFRRPAKKEWHRAAVSRAGATFEKLASEQDSLRTRQIIAYHLKDTLSVRRIVVFPPPSAAGRCMGGLRWWQLRRLRAAARAGGRPAFRWPRGLRMEKTFIPRHSGPSRNGVYADDRSGKGGPKVSGTSLWGTGR